MATDAPVPPVPQEPRTRSQWRWAVNHAEALLQLDACRQYGLVIGGPKVNADRCREIIERGKQLGRVASKKGVTQALNEIIAASGR